MGCEWGEVSSGQWRADGAGLWVGPVPRLVLPVPLLVLVLLVLLLLLLLVVVVVVLLLLLSGSCYSQRTHAFHTTR